MQRGIAVKFLQSLGTRFLKGFRILYEYFSILSLPVSNASVCNLVYKSFFQFYWITHAHLILLVMTGMVFTRRFFSFTQRSKLLLFFILLTNAVHGTIDRTYEEFIKSFVMHYDFSPEGRYTHEYHPFLLEKTRTSLENFEQYLQAAGFDCKGRIVIMGYQQEGVPSYYSSFTAPVLTDEASLSSKRGRVVPAHNIFGFLTGFLLKDANWLQESWYPDQPLLVEHILPERVDLFDDYAYIFQKHAFGKDFQVILQNRRRVEKSLKSRNPHALLKELIYFWERAYKGELKSCAQEVLATQDILFSIDYAKHLCTSSIPVSKMYVGPDITYPIEVLSFQEQEVTEAAQYFVRHFTQTLKPCDDKKTAYIFCSFVDGVGKSTLLGNVINWVTHKDAVDKYERVDNSSSQKGVLYPLTSDVFIMDLPAQLSHWVGKPDGQVFVDIACVQEITPTVKKSVTGYIEEHAVDLKEEFSLLQSCYRKNGIKPEGLLGIYLENVMLFEPEQHWIPCQYEGWFCLFEEADPSHIRVLVPLEGVHSKGLKTAQPEQMLFSKGLMIPLRFDAFMEDVVVQFKNAGIEKLVFVDFLSMYPRSSRETVRVNFLLQHLKKMYKEFFCIDTSLYRSFVNREVELYHMLSAYKQDFVVSLALEAMARASLYWIFTEKSSDLLTLVTTEQVTESLVLKNTECLKESSQFLFQTVQEKIESEHRVLERYAFDKKYELFARFSFEPLYAFSAFIEDLFLHHFDHPYFPQLWEGMDGELLEKNSSLVKVAFQGKAALKAASLVGQGRSGGTGYASEQQLTTGMPFRCLDSISMQCRDSVTLSPVLPVIRAHWYVALANLLFSEETTIDRFTCHEPRFYVPPLAVKRGGKQTAAVIQKQLEIHEEKVRSDAQTTLQMFNNYNWHKGIAWAEFKQIPHCTEWSGTETFYGLYGFGYDWKQSSYIRKIARDMCDKRIKSGYEDPALFAYELTLTLDQTQAWRLAGAPQKDTAGSSSKNGKEKKISVESPRGRAIALWVRAIATLEMLIKDPHSVIVTRKGVQADFIAAMRLLERVTLPRYFGIELDKPLFADYGLVQPVIPWEVMQ